jgi:hypothetical protein
MLQTTSHRIVAKRERFLTGICWFLQMSETRSSSVGGSRLVPDDWVRDPEEYETGSENCSLSRTAKAPRIKIKGRVGWFLDMRVWDRQSRSSWRRSILESRLLPCFPLKSSWVSGTYHHHKLSPSDWNVFFKSTLFNNREFFFSWIV